MFGLALSPYHKQCIHTNIHTLVEKYACAGIWCLLTWFRLVCLVYFMTITEPPNHPATPNTPNTPTTVLGLTGDQRQSESFNYNTQPCLWMSVQHGGGTENAAGAVSIYFCMCMCVCRNVFIYVVVCVSLVAFAACLTRPEVRFVPVFICVMFMFATHINCVAISVCVCVCVCVLTALSSLLWRFESQNRLKCHLYALNVACARSNYQLKDDDDNEELPQRNSGHDEFKSHTPLSPSFSPSLTRCPSLSLFFLSLSLHQLLLFLWLPQRLSFSWQCCHI